MSSPFPVAGCWLLALLFLSICLLTNPGERHFPGTGDVRYFFRKQTVLVPDSTSQTFSESNMGPELLA